MTAARSTRASFWCRLGVLSAVVGSLSSCGGSDDEGSESAPVSEATVDSIWNGFCVATFTESYEVTDNFAEVAFTVNAGDEFLLARYTSPSSELIQDLPAGPYDFSVDEDPETGSFPFTTDCPLGGGGEHQAVFTDVTLFGEAELTTELCRLPRGTSAPVDGQATGYAIAGSEISFSGPTTYEVFLGPLAADCGGAASAFVSVPHTEVYGTGTWLVPFGRLLTPE